MKRFSCSLPLLGCVLLASACATTTSRYSLLGPAYPPKPDTFEVEVFRDGAPPRPYVKVARLDVHLEKTHFIDSTLAEALPELKKQARLSGSDAIIEIEERSSNYAETKMYHVSATGVRFTNAK